MSRAPRAFDPELLYHVVAKGNNGGAIVQDMEDRELFVWRLDRVATAYEWESFAWCLMTNHAHAVLRAREGAISAGMQELLGEHARAMNQRYRREGHLFRNRFFAKAIETDAHAVASIAYVNRNPKKHRACARAEHWPESSYRATMGYEQAPPWLPVDEILGFFARDRGVARASLAWHVDTGRVPVSDTVTEVQRFEEGLLQLAGQREASLLMSG